MIKRIEKLILPLIFLSALIFSAGVVFNTIYPSGYKLRAPYDTIVAIHTQMAHEYAGREDTVIFDARDIDAYIEGHIPDALPLPQSEYRMRIGDYDSLIRSSKNVLIYCSNERCPLSHKLAQKLAEDYPNVYSFIIYEGIAGWREKQYPIEGGIE